MVRDLNKMIEEEVDARVAERLKQYDEIQSNKNIDVNIIWQQVEESLDSFFDGYITANNLRNNIKESILHFQDNLDKNIEPVNSHKCKCSDGKCNCNKHNIENKEINTEENLSQTIKNIEQYWKKIKCEHPSCANFGNGFDVDDFCKKCDNYKIKQNKINKSSQKKWDDNKIFYDLSFKNWCDTIEKTINKIIPNHSNTLSDEDKNIIWDVLNNCKIININSNDINNLLKELFSKWF